MDPFWTIVYHLRMEYDPAHVAAWLNAVNMHAILVNTNAPADQQKEAENLAKSWLVRLLMSVGVSFEEAMTAADLEDDEFAELED